MDTCRAPVKQGDDPSRYVRSCGRVQPGARNSKGQCCSLRQNWSSSMATTTSETNFNTAAPRALFPHGLRSHSQQGGGQSEPYAQERQRTFFEKTAPTRTRASKIRGRAEGPEPSVSGGKSHKINTFGGRRLWRNAKTHADQHENIRATLDVMAAGLLCTAGVCVHYTSRAVSAAIRHANKNKQPTRP